MSKPLILVTNDDGIIAPGIRALVECASELGEVVVVAPDSPQSAKGHAITVAEPLRLNKVDLFDGIEAYDCTGTPVDCVKLGRKVVLKDRNIDLCLSGVNHGSNAAINILYSGTVSAAMEASLEGINSIGFSLLDYSHDANFEHAKPFLKQIIKDVLENGMGSTKLLNINIPDLKTEEIKGIKICRQANARWVEGFSEATDPRGQKYYWLTGEFENPDEGTDTDIHALESGYISVVPSQHDLTDYKAIDGLLFLENKNGKSNS